MPERQRVQASRNDGLHGLWQGQLRIRREATALVGAHQEATVEKQAHVLLGVERVAPNEVDDALP